MKHYSFLRVIAFAVVFITAMAFSCQDHNIPDPVTNCSRVDGTPREFDCEFEFVKAEFYNVLEYSPVRHDTVVYATATPASPNVVIKEPSLADWIISSASLFFFIELPVRVTIKRIAPPPSSPATYFLRKDFTVYSGGVEFPSYKDFSLPEDDTYLPVSINIPVGATYTFRTSYIWSGNATDKGTYVSYGIDGANNYFLLQNVETSKLLRQAPNNYSLYRDIAEAKLLFHPSIIPSTDPFRVHAGNTQ
ncbi:hypothetical protein SAMN05216327_101333 [Dyadobacter sp. SG02]|uniref:hypothetical protein n=1 Tax=Dyadobacter sp. SG02 TaxID=1855291 RepID=UPI0008CD9A95|nr:hypothetical protein [Dyadobacter sp. SG02]SEI41075.1 hypothetical protein SAMN05216327_101333 [Dyadobacter sp. SG02]